MVLPPAPVAIEGLIGNPNDTDYYRVELPPGKTLTATLKSASGNRFDVDLFVYNRLGRQIASSVNGPGEVDTASVTNRSDQPRIRYVRVRHSSGFEGWYSLTLGW